MKRVLALSTLVLLAVGCITEPDELETQSSAVMPPFWWARAAPLCAWPAPVAGPWIGGNLQVIQGPAGPIAVFFQGGNPAQGRVLILNPNAPLPPNVQVAIGGVPNGNVQAGIGWVMGGNGRGLMINQGGIQPVQLPAPGGGVATGGVVGGAGAATAWGVAWPLIVAGAVAGTVVYVWDCSAHDECLVTTVNQAGGWGPVLGFVPDPNSQGNPGYITASCAEVSSNGLTAACWNAIGNTQTNYGNGLSGLYTCRDVYSAGPGTSSIWDSWQEAVNLCNSLVADCEASTRVSCNLPQPIGPVACAAVE